MLTDLVNYAKDHLENGNYPPPFYDYRTVRWTITLNPNGTPVHRAPIERVDDEHRHGVPHLAPSLVRANATAPTLGTDNIEYILGRDHESTEEGYTSERARKRLLACIDFHQAWARADPDSTAAAAIEAFYRNGHHRTIELPERVNDKGERKLDWQRSDLVAFTITGEIGDACTSASARAFWQSTAIGRKVFDAHGICLVCGTSGQLLRTLPQQIPQRLVPGATQNAALTSINNRTQGFDLVDDLRHTPICVDCGLRAVTAIKHLLGDADHSMFTGRGRMIWWSRGSEAPIGVLSEPSQYLDDINDMIRAAKNAASDAVEDAADAVERFYSATISGYSSRVVISDWTDMPLAAVHRNLGRWFDQIRTGSGRAQSLPSIGQLALACGKRVKDGKSTKYADFGNKGADRPNTVTADLYATALFGRPLPRRLIEHLVRRFSRDGYIDQWRATLLRYWFNETLVPQQERMPMALDEDRSHPVYLAGRLFALYEYLQYAANHPRPRVIETEEGEIDTSTELNTSFHDRYYSGALKNPSIVIVAGEGLSSAWLRRVRSNRPGLARWFEKTVDDIMIRIDQVPTAIGLDGKVEFLLGYHHQRHNRWSASNTDTDTTIEENE
jgi:CRISPR-associated protein Csd1